MITIELPYPPSVNTMYRTFRGRMLLSAKGREYIETVGWCLKMAPEAPRSPLSARLKVEILAYVPDARVRDLDNLLKASLDACTKGGLWLSDGLIDFLSVQRMPKVTDGKLIVHVTSLEPSA